MSQPSRNPILAPASRVGNSRRRAHELVVPRGRRVYRTRDRSESTPLRKVTLGVAAAVGFFCGFYYFRRGDLAITALYLTAGALILSLTVAGWGLVLAIIAALGVPLAYAAMGIAGVRIFYPPEPNLAATLLALLPTVTGAMMGLGLRWVFFGESGAPVSR